MWETKGKTINTRFPLAWLQWDLPKETVNSTVLEAAEI